MIRKTSERDLPEFRLLPVSNLDMFVLGVLEIWGVGESLLEGLADGPRVGRVVFINLVEDPADLFVGELSVCHCGRK